ncbi:DUF2510 domain-containing protein, partial [Streptomyces sp. B1866]|uniref:DUF2510 domain-containing protein n=1 Tax=Streptomyces sp. B1866 TaxID=3075431 RepID=UPI0028925D34
MTSGSGEAVPGPGYYPDPSIPGYIRYWNGAAWVPGTSRPAPGEAEAVPGPPSGAAHARAVGPAPEETGPVFLDEGPLPEPSGPPGLSGPDGSGVADGSGGTGGSLPELRARGEVDVRDTGGAAAMSPVPLGWDDPRRLHGTRPEPAPAWQPDAGPQAAAGLPGAVPGGGPGGSPGEGPGGSAGG